MTLPEAIVWFVLLSIIAFAIWSGYRANTGSGGYRTNHGRELPIRDKDGE